MLKCVLFCFLPLICLGTLSAQTKDDSTVNTRKENVVEPLTDRHYLMKRLIKPSQLGTPLQPQLFQPPFGRSTNPTNDIVQFSQLGQRSQDEETKFFLSQETTTTLNSASFFTEQTTQIPVEQPEGVNEQRRFQEEIANRGLREQQQRSFGLSQSPTTRPTINPILFQEQLQSQPFRRDPNSLKRPSIPSSELFQSPEFSAFVQPVPQLYANHRSFRFTSSNY